MSDQAKIDAALWRVSYAFDETSQLGEDMGVVVAAYREQQEQLRLYREGYQGGCMACEPVALRNQELEERLHVQKQVVRRLRWVIKEMRFRGLPPQVDLLAAQALAGEEMEQDG